MSLIHWWSLNGDTQDHIGGKHGTLVGGGNVSAVGKIGKCYSSINNASNVSSSSDGVSIPNCNLVGEVGNEYSFACWFLVHGTHGQYQSCIMSSGDWNQGNCWVIGFNNANTEICCPVDNYDTGKIPIGYQLNNNVWYHLSTVYKDGVTTAFLNGEVVGTVSRQGIYRSYSNHSYIGRDEGHGGFFPFNGDINDLRIYDHALSQAEVKELSKGLVIHYTFNDTLIENTTNLIPSSLQNMVVNTSTNAGSAATYEVTSGLTQGVYYTLSSYITRSSSDTSTNPRLTLILVYSDGTSTQVNQYYNTEGTNFPKDDKEYYYVATAKADSSKTLTRVWGWLLDHSSGSGKVISYRNAQLETKDHTTPYTPGSRSSLLYNETGLTQPSTKNNIVLSTDSGVGTYSLNCQGTTEIATSNICDISQGTTASFWVKGNIPTDSRLVFADSNSKTAFGFFNNGQAIITCAGYGHACVSNIKTGWKTDWNHIVVTRDSSGTVSCYLNNNKLSLSSSQEWTHTIENTLSIGCRYNGGWTSYYTGLIDDFRFYATCLSSDDIKNLYQTKAYISDKGDIMCNEFVEKFENIINEKDFAIPASQTAGNGTIEIRNNVLAYGLQANSYWYGGDTTETLQKSNSIFKGRFKANTQYYFDLWMDVDGMYYSTDGSYKPGGFTILYTDNSSEIVTATSVGGKSGWQRIQFYSNASKSIYGLGIYYWIGNRWYLRTDSGIYEVNKDIAKVNANCTVQATQFNEISFSDTAQIHISGNIIGRNLIEI